MADSLSEKLGLDKAEQVAYEIYDQYSGSCGGGHIKTRSLEQDRQDTVEAVAKWFGDMIVSDKDRGTTYAADLIRRELLGEAK